MLSEQDILINRIAQDKISLEEGLDWFDKLDRNTQRDVVSWTRVYLEQSHPDQRLIDEAITLVPLKETMTPIVLFKTQSFKNAAMKVNNLPDDELRKSFITLVTLFKHSDTRRRKTFCKYGCYHEWHNLDNPQQGSKSLLVRLINFLTVR